MSKLALTSLEVREFRCFEHLAIRELKKVNILVGPNNVGKTALMAALRRLTRVDERYVPKVGVPDGVGAWGSEHYIRLSNDNRHASVRPSVTIVFRDSEKSSPTTVAIPQDLQTNNGDDNQRNLIAIRDFASRVVYVPSRRRAPTELRRHDPTVHEERLYDGSDLLVELVEACVLEQRPNRLNVVEEHLANLLGTTVKLKLTVDPPSLGLSLGGSVFRSLSDLGEGISQLVVLAGAVASVREPLVLLEEPETGLHPALQRRLLDFLVKCPGLQCILSTHSNHILDAVHPEVAIFRLHCDSAGARHVDRIGGSDLKTLADLGVRPSSVAATNCVVWVEGPSDAMYIAEWLKHKAPDLDLWRDYGFAFFGGALLEHASVDDESLVRLLRINPSFYLVADSDRSSSDEALGKKYLRRVELTLPAERMWITGGREIESYISDKLLTAALGRDATDLAFSRVETPGAPLEQRLKALHLPVSTPKVALASKIVSIWGSTPEWTLDLEQKIDALASFIRACRDRIPALDA